MELQRLIHLLDQASFRERQAIAAAAVRTATRPALERIARLLIHPSENVRLGAMEILATARFRPALSVLAEAARKRRGDEQVFAVRALVHLAEPGDRAQLEALARAWQRHDSELLRIQAAALLARLQGGEGDSSGGRPSESASESASASGRPTGSAAWQLAAPTAVGSASESGSTSESVSASESENRVTAAGLAVGLTSPDRAMRQDALVRVCASLSDPGPILADALLATRHAGARLDLITALEGLGPKATATAAPRLLDDAPDGDLVALVARALGRQLPRLPAEQVSALRQHVIRASRRQVHHVLARAALDECLLIAPDEPALALLVSRIDQLSATAGRRLAERLAALPADQRLAHWPVLLDALVRMPRRALLLSDLLRADWPRLSASQRAAAREILHTAASAPLPEGLSANALARIGRVYACAQVPGMPPPRLVLDALAARAEPEAKLAVIAIHAAVATEASARELAAYLRVDPTLPGSEVPGPAAPDEARAAARAALEGLALRHVRVVFEDSGAARIEPDYRTPAGELLVASHGALTDAAGTRYVLDASGDPVAEQSTDWGGCRCCERPRALVHAPERRPSCPVTDEPHLIDDGQTMLEREHSLGGCTACAAARPLVREGDMVRCAACHTEHVRVGGRYMKRRRTRRRPAGEPLERLGPLQRRDLPEPPGPGDLTLVEPAIAHAMAANIFLVGESADSRWIGSGVIVAREHNDIAILTNRHVVEDRGDDGRTALARVQAFTITGELVPGEVRWRAAHGVDLALVVVRLQAPEGVAVTRLQDGACLVGSRLFAIGNPLGLSWSYSSGTLAAFRNADTASGLSVRFIQSHVTMSPGSSGGGLYHESGHLVGINSFGQGSGDGPGGDHNFSIAMPSVLAALRREDVLFAGKPLVSREI